MKLGTPHRLRTIYRTNLNTSRAVARQQMMRANADKRPYWMYDALLDGRTRPEHAAMDGMVFPADDPIWNTHAPPNGFNCRCRIRALSAEEVEQRGLSISSSAGKLHQVAQRVGLDKRTGEIITRPATEFRSGSGKAAVRMTPDPGWNYNPGATGGDPGNLPPLAVPARATGRRADPEASWDGSHVDPGPQSPSAARREAMDAAMATPIEVPSQYGDRQALAVAAARWGDQASEIVDRAACEALPSRHWARGIKDRGHLNAQLDGTAGVNFGVFGHGLYFAAARTRAGRNVAAEYGGLDIATGAQNAGRGVVYRAQLRRGAAVKRFGPSWDGPGATTSSYDVEEWARERAARLGIDDPLATGSYDRMAAGNLIARVAALDGYAAIEVIGPDSVPYLIVFDRSALIVDGGRDGRSVGIGPGDIETLYNDPD